VLIEAFGGPVNMDPTYGDLWMKWSTRESSIDWTLMIGAGLKYAGGNLLLRIRCGRCVGVIGGRTIGVLYFGMVRKNTEVLREAEKGNDEWKQGNGVSWTMERGWVVFMSGRETIWQINRFSAARAQY